MKKLIPAVWYLVEAEIDWLGDNPRAELVIKTDVCKRIDRAEYIQWRHLNYELVTANELAIEFCVL